MPAGSAASWELRKGIFLRLGFAIAALVALILAWYAVISNEPRVPLDAPARTTQVAGPSDASSSATPAAQSIAIAPVVREERPALPIGSATPVDERKQSDAKDPLHSEGIIRTLPDTASTQRVESQHVAVAQTTAKPKLPAGPYVQVGVFTHPANAAELKARLEAQGIPVVIATRVQVGPFKSRKEAEEMREKLKAMGMASIVINQ
jgi:cell division protein FtsN